MQLSVLGLGKIGAPLAAVLASKGHHVIGVDSNAACVRRLGKGEAPVQEPDLEELISANRDQLTATLSYEEAVLGSDVSFVVVPAPSGVQGTFCNSNIVAAVRQIGQALRQKSTYHVVSIFSTVMPGSTGGEIREALEHSSGRLTGRDIGLCYNPGFIALGSVIHDMLNPDFILLGESDSKAGEIVESLYRSVCGKDVPVRRMNLINAEIAKISLNTYLTTKITYANMLADICERIPDADVDVVTCAMGVDSRVGAKYLKSGTGYGGPCFPRDNIALAALASSIGARADIAEATDRLNRYQTDRLVAHVQSRISPPSRVGILGLSYKPDTSVVEESSGVALARRLLDAGYMVKVFDPMGLDSARAIFGAKIVCESMEACVDGVDLIVITTPWPAFSALRPDSLKGSGKRPIIIDCWRILPKDRFKEIVDIVYLGYGC